MSQKRVIVALDVPTIDAAGGLIEQLSGEAALFKVGLELLHAEGTPQAIQYVTKRSGAVFADVKLKDIPKTVTGAVRAITRQGVRMLNVHCLGGPAMMYAAATAAAETARLHGIERPAVIGVTLLTSLDFADLVELGLWHKCVIADPVARRAEEIYRIRSLVQQLACKAKASGLDGVVCSADDVKFVREVIPDPSFLLVTPGSRPTWYTEGDDQKRVATPGEAVRNGASFPVLGRPVTKPPAEIGSPLDAILKINAEIEEALTEKEGSAQ